MEKIDKDSEDERETRKCKMACELGSTEDRVQAEDDMMSMQKLAAFRCATLAILLAQCVWSIHFQPTSFFHMYTNWSLFLVTSHFVAAVWWSMVSQRNSWKLHAFMSATAIMAGNAMALVVPVYWVNGADKFNVNPVLMFLNHSWTWFLIFFEVAVGGTVVRLKHFVFFVPYHLLYAICTLPILQKKDKDPYNLPVSFEEEPAVAYGLAAASLVASLLVGHGSLMLVQTLYNRRKSRTMPQSEALV